MNGRLPIHLVSPLLGAALAFASVASLAQPTFGNPSPTAGSETSQRANESADQALYKPVEYMNRNRKGPALIVIPGEIKSSNALSLPAAKPRRLTAATLLDDGSSERPDTEAVTP